ncbi:MAG: trigger factor [Clostridiales bacterium]|nr:trigger factor [Clostridiales bacterium]
MIRKRKIKALTAVLAMTALITACGNQEYLKDINAGDYVTLGNYMGIEAQAEAPAVDDSMVDLYLEYYILASYTTTEEVTGRAVQEGDVVNIDFVGYHDGEAFDGGTGEGYDLTIGSGQFIDGFEDGLIGANVGDTVSLDLTFPDPYTNNTDLSGEPVVFEVTVNSISEQKQPELTDEFVQSLGIEGCSTEQELRDYLYNYFYESAVQTYDSTIEQSIQDTVMAGCTFKEPPKEMVARIRQSIEDSLTAQAQSLDMTLTEYVQSYYGLDEDGFEEQLDSQALESTQLYIMYQAIADIEGLNPTDEELQEEIDYRVEAYGYESEEDFRESTDVEVLREYLMRQNVVAFLKENADITTIDDTQE